MDWVDGAPVHRLRFAVADGTRPLVETYRHPLPSHELDRQIAEFEPDLIYQVSGVYFGVVPLELAAGYGIPSVLFATDFWHICQRHTLLRPDGTICPGPSHPADCATCRMTARRPFGILGHHVQELSWKSLASSGHLATRLAQLHTKRVHEAELRASAIQQAMSSVGFVICNSRVLAQLRSSSGSVSTATGSLSCATEIESLEAVAPTRLQRADGALRVLYLGQLTRHKGIDITLHIYGSATDGDFRVRDTKGGWILAGNSLPRDGINRALAEEDVLVAPSRWYENSPNVIPEAQSMRVRVVASGHGGSAEMVRHGIDGLLFPSGSATALAAALRQLAVDRELLWRLSSNAIRPQSMRKCVSEPKRSKISSPGDGFRGHDRAIVNRLSARNTLLIRSAGKRR